MHPALPKTLIAVACLFVSSITLAQPNVANPTAETVLPPALPSIQLSSTQSNESEIWTRAFNQIWVRNVQAAAVYPFRPSQNRANGRAVIVVPGGGYEFVSMSSEGFDVAERLAAKGYHVFVLKYRTRPTPADPVGFMAQISKSFAQLGKGELVDHPPAVDDLAKAIDYVRQNAGLYGVRNESVGVIGFSAGARTSIRVLEQNQQSAFLDHVALIYPPTVHPVKSGPRPNLFLAISVDDPLFEQGGLHLLSEWLKESRRVEFHLYSGGRHGFGLRPRGTTSDRWLEQYIEWLDGQKN